MAIFNVNVVSEIHHGWQSAEVEVEAPSEDEARVKAMDMVEAGEIFFTVDEIDEADINDVMVELAEPTATEV